MSGDTESPDDLAELDDPAETAEADTEPADSPVIVAADQEVAANSHWQAVYHLVDTPGKFAAFVEQLKKQSLIAIDLDGEPEPASEQPHRGVPGHERGGERRSKQEQRITRADVFRLVTQHEHARRGVERERPLWDHDAR